MAGILEVSKLITASYLERYWKTINWIRKTYLTSAVLILMFITSLGIYGFLVSAYQETAYKVQEVEKKVLVQETKKDRCFRCDEKITNYIELSIDHMDAWLDQDNSVFWNLNNIAYSHLTCNSAKSATSSINKHPSYNSYSSGCRCDACTMCKMMYQRYSRWKKDKYG